MARSAFCSVRRVRRRARPQFGALAAPPTLVYSRSRASPTGTLPPARVAEEPSSCVRWLGARSARFGVSDGGRDRSSVRAGRSRRRSCTRVRERPLPALRGCKWELRAPVWDRVPGLWAGVGVAGRRELAAAPEIRGLSFGLARAGDVAGSRRGRTDRSIRFIALDSSGDPEGSDRRGKSLERDLPGKGLEPLAQSVETSWHPPAPRRLRPPHTASPQG